MISVIILTLNEEASLPALLDAIHQQETESEVIVVDGGSQDRTLEVARGRGAQSFLSPPGRGNAICVGAAEARGEVLLFLHADSTLHPGALARKRSRPMRNSSAGIFGSSLTATPVSADGLPCSAPGYAPLGTDGQSAEHRA
jgi:glycosyltransferase involved in cell wall biosynthesis